MVTRYFHYFFYFFFLFNFQYIIKFLLKNHIQKNKKIHTKICIYKNFYVPLHRFSEK